MEKPAVVRRYDLDWLRVFAILTAFVFHSGRFFDQMDWHVKDPIRYEGVQIWTMFLGTWMMPLIFFIWHIPGPAKFLLIGMSSFAIILLIYEFLIRRVNLMRFLFGMKPRRSATASERAVRVQAAA